MSDHEEEFENAISAESLTFPQQCSALRKNGHVMIKGNPCKIVEMTTSKTGKHGHAKVHLVGINIFNDKKYEDMCPSTHNMDVPVIKRQEYQLNNIEEGFCTLMDENGKEREDLKLPENDIGDEIKKRFESGNETLLVTVLKAIDKEQIISVKKASAD
ncbi:eukaryotic translation initiation factor 5A-1-like [Gigantopelta aegis]|uniref:eukaryotic translation initiation factor 5A-1-like n=1 Tax=Gigantopelta aegis TaxID=1735272 RepID=UPI001B88D2E8|nr:eukaryotic translation initiation factor 5A-1-like [Gigantopelta aegis]